ncbi:MAG: pyroglutamyl-peptidase I [Candidatus Thorarchaeota archaeon]
MPRVLVTGFEPFDDFSINPSEEVVKSLDGLKVTGFDVHGLVLPLDYEKAFTKMESVMDSLEPEFILCFGQAYRGGITLERIAINAVSTTRADNYGHTPESDIILEDAPAAYFTTIMPHPIVEHLRRARIPSGVSYHAGTFGCNWILFRVLHKLTTERRNGRALFVHLPALPEQAVEKSQTNLATMPLETQVRAAEIIISMLK